MENNEKMCRLCLEPIANGSFELLDAVKLQMLKIILDLNIPASTEPVICSECAKVLQQCFDFKMACLSNNDYLTTFHQPEAAVKVYLQEIIFKKHTRYEIKCEEENVCRLCLDYFDVNMLSQLDLLMKDIFFIDMFGKCLPEIDLTISVDPLICCSCMELLQVQFNFIMVCLDSDDRTSGYDRPRNTKYISNIEGIEYIENVKREYDALDLCSVKQEKQEFNETEFVSVVVLKQDDEFEEVPKSAYIKMEDRQYEIPDTDSLSNATSDLQYPETSYTCPKCPHVTNRKGSLKLHLLIHDKTPEFKCPECNFKSRWKTSLHQHLLLHKDPGDITMYRCAHCPYQSKYKKHIRRHSKQHMDTKAVETYKCQYCAFKSKDRWYFKQHNRMKHCVEISQFEKSFDCTKCSYQSKYQSNLKTHKITAHKIYRFECDYGSCAFKTAKLDHWKDHLLKHQSSKEVHMFRCDTCEFETKYKKSLKSHTALHQRGKTVKLRKAKKSGKAN